MSIKQYLYRLWQWVYKGIPVVRVNTAVTTIQLGKTRLGRKNLITGGSQGIGLQIAKRFATKGMRCNVIALWGTADTQSQPELYDDAYLKGAIGKRYIMPNELAETSVFLMFDVSRCISGEMMLCNQGIHYK